MGELRVGVRQDRHGAQTGDGIVDLPGAVLRVDVQQVVVGVVGEEAAGGGENSVRHGVAHREGDAGVVVDQAGGAEAPFNVVGEMLLEDRVGGLDGEHLAGTVVQVQPLGEEGAHPEAVLLEEGGDLFEGVGLAADVEGGKEGGREAAANAVLAQDPEHDPVLFVGVDEEQPAGKTRVHHRRDRVIRIIRSAGRAAWNRHPRPGGGGHLSGGRLRRPAGAARSELPAAAFPTGPAGR